MLEGLWVDTRAWQTYAKETLLSSTLKQNTTASGRTCFAICQSNSNRPPPAIPPEPFVNHLPIRTREDRGLLAFLNPPAPVGARGKEGATAAPSPSLRRGFARPRVRLEKVMRNMWVRTSWTYVPVSGNGNLSLLATNLQQLFG